MMKPHRLSKLLNDGRCLLKIREEKKFWNFAFNVVNLSQLKVNAVPTCTVIASNGAIELTRAYHKTSDS